MNQKQLSKTILAGLACVLPCVVGASSIDNAAVSSLALSEHNHYRSAHHSPNMNLSNSLNASAKQWAEHLASTGALQHSPSSQRNDAGENLYASFTTASAMPVETLAKNAVESWYNEVNDYNYANPGFSAATGHFTQIVWKSTTQLGCGAAQGAKNMGGRQYNAYYVVCHYAPAGNVLGQFPTNVMKP